MIMVVVTITTMINDDDDINCDDVLVTMMIATLPVRFAPLGIPMAISG